MRNESQTVGVFIFFACLIGVWLGSSALAATHPIFLLRKTGTTTVYLRYAGDRIIHRIPDPATAVKVVGKYWNRKVRILSTKAFAYYRRGSPIPIVRLPPATRAPLASTAGTPTIAGCAIFPRDNPWNQDVSHLPINAMSATYIASIGSRGLHPDFGEDQTYGIPITVASAHQPNVPITFTAYGDESDPGPYPIPADARVESGSDAHVLVLQSGACKLYELYNARKAPTGSGWLADSGAAWNLSSDALRPEGWTSADAAGLPILPGLVRYDEVAAGVINHAIRFTAHHTQNGWIHPATHQAGKNNPALPPMGLRVRLKADYDLSSLTGQALVIATAMKKYGMILADNGSSWFFQGATDPRWKDDQLNELKTIPGTAFEAVETGPIIK